MKKIIFWILISAGIHYNAQTYTANFNIDTDNKDVRNIVEVWQSYLKTNSKEYWNTVETQNLKNFNILNIEGVINPSLMNWNFSNHILSINPVSEDTFIIKSIFEGENKSVFAISKLAISTHPDEDLKNIYVSYANSLDHQKKPEAALKIYDEGLKKYPDYYHLYFNKGISLINSRQTEKALLAFQKSAQLNPNHSSSFNALAALNRDKKIPSILASSRYLLIDNTSARAKGNLDSVIDLMNQGVSQKKDQSINLMIDPETLEKANAKKKTENNFGMTDVVLTMAAALDYDDKNKDKTEVQKFIIKFEALCSSLSETKKGQKGFYWEFLAPYFIEMNEKKLLEPFAYIAFAPKQTADVIKYHEDNAQKIKDFYQWSDNYVWK